MSYEVKQLAMLGSGQQNDKTFVPGCIDDYE